MFCKPRRRLIERLRDKLAPALATTLDLPHEPGPLQHPQMLGDCRRAKVERPRYLGNRFLADHKRRHDRSPCGVGQRQKNLTELLILHRLAKYQCGTSTMSIGWFGRKKWLLD